MRSLRVLAAVTALFGYVLVALSPIVRITGSGMGCGDDWPLCNGRLIPPLDRLDVMIEWGHRMAVVGLTVLVVALLAAAWTQRRQPGVAGPGGVLRPTVVAAVLLVLQSLLGAITVWLELPPAVVIVHLGNAMVLLAVLCVAAWRAQRAGAVLAGAEPASPRAWRSALVAAGLGAVALLLGGLTANLHAGWACTGFPLCSGQWWPAAGAGGLAHVHWMHRLVAYALVLHLIGMLVSLGRRGEPRGVQGATWLAAGVLAAHVGVAVWMIGQALPLSLRAAHAALGALVWVSLVYLGWQARPAARPTS